MKSFLKDMLGLSESGYVSSFMVGENCKCRALLREDGKIISHLDCFNINDTVWTGQLISHKVVGAPHIESYWYSTDKRSLEDRVADYKDYEKMKIFTIKI